VHGWLAAANGVTLSASLYASGWLNDAYGQQGYLVMAVMAGGALAASFALFAATRHGLRRDEKKGAGGRDRPRHCGRGRALGVCQESPPMCFWA
jgi:MFS family permease